jgi:hypothetical protein
MSLIRFCYPNIFDKHPDAGCGRFLSSNKAVALNTILHPYAIFLCDRDRSKFALPDCERILEYVGDLVEKSGSPRTMIRQHIHEYRDKDLPYGGKSQALAYILCAMSRYRTSIWENDANPHANYDIWATCGGIQATENKLCLLPLNSDVFKSKLKQFIESDDHLFIVPSTNLDTPNLILDNLTIITLNNAKKMNYAELVTGKKLLRVRREELDELLCFVFDIKTKLLKLISPPLSQAKKKIGISILLLLIILLLFWLYRPAPAPVPFGKIEYPTGDISSGEIEVISSIHALPVSHSFVWLVVQAGNNYFPKSSCMKLSDTKKVTTTIYESGCPTNHKLQLCLMAISKELNARFTNFTNDCTNNKDCPGIPSSQIDVDGMILLDEITVKLNKTYLEKNCNLKN